MTKTACAVLSGRPQTGLAGSTSSSLPRDRIGRAIIDQSLAEWQAIVDSHLKVSWLFCREAGRLMIQQGRGGKVVLVGSQRGQLGMASYSGYSRAIAASTSSPALWHGSGASTASTSTAWHRGCSGLRLPSGCGVTTPRTSACSAGSPSGGSASQGIRRCGRLPRLSRI